MSCKVPIYKVNTTSPYHSVMTLDVNSGMIINEGDNSLNLIWVPTPDITTYELAVATPYISSHKLKIMVDCDEFYMLAPEVKRHFAIDEVSIPIWESYNKEKNLNILIDKL